MESSVKTIFFDLDDTLVNSKKAEYNAICEFKGLYNIFSQIEDAEFAKTWSKVTMENYEKYHSGEITFEELRMKRMQCLFATYNAELSDNEAKEKFKEYQTIYEKNWLLFDDAINLLEELKGNFNLAILSNGDGKQQRRKIEYTGLKNYFPEIIISSEVNVSKPDKKIFEIACEKTNSKPEECIMVGDKYGTDIEGALNAGLKAIWVDRKNETRDYKYKIKELGEIRKFIKV